MRSRDEITFPDWQPEYQAALFETDQQKRRENLYVAEIAIVNRLQALRTSTNGHIERAAIADAIRNLRRLQIETMGYPASAAPEAEDSAQTR
jgi:hypothetical protein